MTCYLASTTWKSFCRFKANVGGSICRGYWIELTQPPEDTWTHVTALIHEDPDNNLDAIKVHNEPRYTNTGLKIFELRHEKTDLKIFVVVIPKEGLEGGGTNFKI